MKTIKLEITIKVPDEHKIEDPSWILDNCYNSHRPEYISDVKIINDGSNN